MARIYQEAKQVMFWLGVTSDRDNLVQLSSIDEADWVFTTQSKYVCHLPRSWLQHINRPWFLRVWIIQKVGFARKVRVIHGRKKTPWRDFARISDDFEES